MDLVQEVKDGRMDGQIVWICDLRFNNYMDKPIRHVRPIKVLVRDNDELKNKTIYYSSSHFIGLNAKGEPIKSKVIALYDNTGYRSLSGTPLEVFKTEKACRNRYDKLCEQAIKGLTVHKRAYEDAVDEKIAKIEDDRVASVNKY